MKRKATPVVKPPSRPARAVAVRTTFNSARREALQAARAAVSSDSSCSSSEETSDSSSESEADVKAPQGPGKLKLQNTSDDDSDSPLGGGNDYFSLQRQAGKASGATLAEVAFPGDAELPALLDKVKEPHMKELSALRSAHTDRFVLYA